MGAQYGGPSYGEQFPADYKAMLELVRAKNPNAYILCVYGMMGTNVTVNNGIQTAISQMNDSKISHMLFTPNSFGANGHPTAAASEQWANELAQAIENLLS